MSNVKIKSKYKTSMINGDIVLELEMEKQEMLECLIWEFRASVKQFGLEKAKGLQTRYVIEKATGLTIEEVLK